MNLYNVNLLVPHWKLNLEVDLHAHIFSKNLSYEFIQKQYFVKCLCETGWVS